ncbi:BlaB/IND/MUS family subclass B1 metallo-beta-lactamase [Sphingobacterium sp. SRCM116780]|uniref:BlaB/IND/MUS family subclass B1 metallo-beta-lactamase n=1 Tax=Sphingobacterium sp. SRCM116780 TaxID=2907623 RepID=UPI001EFF34CC|nr:BlaB/IND/MUS family subclass B1 metallo-beta-lactamase [Sphingobacterium sp. SRCM116780]UIR57899.1 BlaB/IND/MUS family subclass B1 metallo-beta-lactamase [Sphingobacterium sp. SRCM116780]
MKINFKTALIKMYVISIFSLSITSLFAQNPVLKIEKINPKLYVHTTYNVFNGQQYSANGLYLITKKGVVIFDTPWDQTQYQPLLDSIKNKHHLPVIAIFASHWHEDRAGGFAYYNKIGVPTYATAQTNTILKANNKASSTKEIVLGKTYRIGGEKFKIEYFGEGHSLDNTVVWFPKYQVLNGGCLIKSAEATNLGFVGDGNVAAWPATIQKLEHAHPVIKKVISGHDNWKLDGHLERTKELLNQK